MCCCAHAVKAGAYARRPKPASLAIKRQNCKGFILLFVFFIYDGWWRERRNHLLRSYRTLHLHACMSQTWPLLLSISMRDLLNRPPLAPAICGKIPRIRGLRPPGDEALSRSGGLNGASRACPPHPTCHFHMPPCTRNRPCASLEHVWQVRALHEALRPDSEQLQPEAPAG